MSFAPVIPPVPLFDNGPEPQHESGYQRHFPNPSFSSWDILQSANFTPSPWGTEDFPPILAGPGCQSGYFHAYEPSVPSQLAIRSHNAVYLPPDASRILFQDTTPISSDSLRLSSSGNDIEAVSNSKASTKRKRGKLSPVRKAKAKAQRRMGNCVRCRVMKSDVSSSTHIHE